MPSENIYGWSSTASNNGSVDSGINFSEGQAPSTVNNAGRGVMAALARFLGDTGANFSASGTASAYTASILGTHSSYATGQRLRFKAPVANSGGATLNVTNANGSALGAKQIRKFTPTGETSLATSNIVASGIYDFMYDASASGGSGAFVVLNPTRVLADVVTQSTGTGSVVLADTPTLVTPVLGAAVGSSLGLGTNTGLNSGVKLQINANTASLPAPTFTGTVLQIGGADSTAVRVYMDAFASAVATSPTFVFRKARGTAAAKAGIQSGDFLGAFFWDGYDSTGYNANDAAAIIGIAGETFSTTAHGTGFQFRTVPNGGLTTVTAAHFHPGGGIELGANSTDPGLGAIAATAGITAFKGTAIPAGGTAGSGLKVSSATNFGVFFGSGAPSLSAARGSIYMRSDGTTSTTRCYVNSDGGTTWTAILTVA